jgi:hypothetical protein
MPKILITMRGGCIVSIFADEATAVEIIDYDDTPDVVLSSDDCPICIY